jgi:hypothetical protein
MRKIGKGQPIKESVGSLEDHISSLRGAFYKTFPDTEARMFFVRESFEDHLIVYSSELDESQFWRVPYTLGTDEAGAQTITFAAETEWELVELDYVPAQSEKPLPAAAPLTQPLESVKDEKPKGKPFKMGLTERVREAVDTIRGEVIESTGNKRITIREALTAGVINRNGRRYSEAVVKAAVDEIKSHLHESAGQGRAVLITATGDPMVGEADHPSDKSTKRPQLLETVVVWTDVSYDPVSRAVSLSGLIAETAKGKDILALAAVGLLPGGSLRGNGYSQVITENGEQIEEVVELHLTGYDLVLTPSFVNQSVLESVKDKDNESQIPQQEQNNMDAKVLEAMRKSLGLNESASEAEIVAAVNAAAKAQTELGAQVAANTKAQAIDEAVKGLPYGDALNAQFKSELAEDAADAAAVPATVAKLRKRYDVVAAQGALKLQGFKNMQVAPVIERETGNPEFAKVAVTLGENLIARGKARNWDIAKPVGRNEVVAKQMIEHFDRTYARELTEEARRFDEASLSTDLALPYTVSRTIMAAVWPQLIATSIFDVSPMANSPENLFFESYAEESGATGTSTAEVVAAPAVLGNDSALAFQHIVPGTFVLTHSSGTPTYVENTDYFVDYFNGLVFVPASGSAITAAQSLRATYQYKAFRKGENQPIEYAKNTLAVQTITAKADRLATNLTTEAVLFSRSQIGYDLATRTVANLTTEMLRKIDQDLFYLAIKSVRTVASNSGGSWTASGLDYVDLTNKLGVARVKVYNRNYEPTFYLMSVTNSDRAAKWAGFTQAGSRADAELNSNGFAGRINGLPVFQSTQMPDNVIVTGNRELVMFRVYQQPVIKGPFPRYDQATAKLIANDQWYVETFNAAASPVPQKGSFIVVA